jgi:hypothetical protein
MGLNFNSTSEDANLKALPTMFFWYGIVPMSMLQELELERPIPHGNGPQKKFRTFAEYSESYRQADTNKSRFYPPDYFAPVILSTDDNQTFLDGYHKFHWHYVPKNYIGVPALARTIEKPPQEARSQATVDMRTDLRPISS